MMRGSEGQHVEEWLEYNRAAADSPTSQGPHDQLAGLLQPSHYSALFFMLPIGPLFLRVQFLPASLAIDLTDLTSHVWLFWSIVSSTRSLPLSSRLQMAS